MSQLTCCTIVMLLVMLSAISSTLNPASVPGKGEGGTCPLQEERDAAIQNIDTSVQINLQNLINNLDCGIGRWYRVAYLNMSNSSQQCPSAWMEYSNNGVRACRRPQTSSASCPGTYYATNRQYRRVCGRAIGYQYGTTNAFGFHADGAIDSYYVYGVSVTHGSPRNHIWTLAAGISEGEHTAEGWDCPCSKPSDPGNVFPPTFVGNNYFCESGNPTDVYTFNLFYPADPLWDGKQCEGQCCSNGKSPPWFSVKLPNPTTDDIEVRICIPESSQDDVAIQLLELYVQ